MNRLKTISAVFTFQSKTQDSIEDETRKLVAYVFVPDFLRKSVIVKCRTIPCNISASVFGHGESTSAPSFKRTSSW